MLNGNSIHCAKEDHAICKYNQDFMYVNHVFD